jgi:hypothetical protein
VEAGKGLSKAWYETARNVRWQYDWCIGSICHAFMCKRLRGLDLGVLLV